MGWNLEILGDITTNLLGILGPYSARSWAIVGELFRTCRIGPGSVAEKFVGEKYGKGAGKSVQDCSQSPET
jgi:hypothetical protein